MKSTKFLTALLVAGGIALTATVATSAFAQPDGKTHTTAQPDGEKGTEKPKDKDGKKAEKSKGVKPGEMAPDFKLTDTDGKTVSLADFKGKVVVLEWFNAECPFSGVKHHSVNMTFNDLHQQFSSKGVVFLAICSSAEGKQGAGKEFNAKAKTDLKIPFPILLDESGATGKAYGATNTPHCFVIGTDGKVAYAGAIDNDTSPKKAGDKNYVKLALDAVLAGKVPETTQTKAYGCAVKYAK